MTRALAVRPKYEIALRSDVQDIDLVAKAKPDANVSHANIGLTRSTVTDIDKHVNQVSTDKLPSALAKTYADSAYDTVETTSDIYLYRVFGKGAGKQGAFATTRPAQNRIQSKIDSALIPSWKNSREYEAKIKVPAGTKLNVGKVEQQTIEESGTVLKGGADQILLPQGWSEDWITEIRGVKP